MEFNLKAKHRKSRQKSYLQKSLWYYTKEVEYLLRFSGEGVFTYLIPPIMNKLNRGWIKILGAHVQNIL